MKKRIAALAAVAAAGVYMVKNKEKPSSVTRKLTKRVKPNLKKGSQYGNNAALTPPMGWSSWNTFRNDVSEDLIYDVAKAMKVSGLSDAGYNYVNIDDCWQSAVRTDDGELQSDPVTFPSGIKSLVKKINDLGLKVGIYSSNGTLTCEDMPASLGHELTDARTFAKWGIEYFKYDFCHHVYMSRIAPQLEKISVINKNMEHENVYYAKDAILEGDARVLNDGSLTSGNYVTGLSYGCGVIIFDEVEVPEDGTYSLTFYVRKRSRAAKHLEMDINDRTHYVVDFPQADFVHAVGKHHINVKLKKGKNVIKMYNPVGSVMDSSALQYRHMGKCLKQASKEIAEKNGTEEKPIVFSICEWGFNMPWIWGGSAGNLWRTTPDIKPFWASILAIYEVNVKLWKYASPGGWNDPDMLEVGNGNLTYEENKSHFSLWCMMAAPLILGNDVRQFVLPDGTADSENEILKLVTNKKLIALDQDELGAQCRRIRTDISGDVLIKPLSNGDAAVCFFNKSSREKLFALKTGELTELDYIALTEADEYEVEDLWEGTVRTVDYAIADTVAPHGVRVFRVKNK